MSEPAPQEPPPLETRQRALWQGALGVLGSPAGMLGAAWLLAKTGSTSRWPLLVVLILCLAGEMFGAWKLGIARNGRWDGWGLLALALMILGYPLLILFATWVAMGVYVVVTGQPFAPYGN